MRRFSGLAEVKAAAGEHLGYTDWFTIDQERINRFADATDDHQWIHIDAERAAAGPFGTTIAHGYLVLSLLPMITSQVFGVDGVRMAVNYGLNRVRFPAPVPVATPIRGGVELLTADEVDGGLQVLTRVTVERENADKPSMVAETLARFYG